MSKIDQKNKLDEINEIFAERLKVARALRNFTRNQLASSIGVSNAAIAKVESGACIFSSKNLVSTSELLNIPFDFFFTDSPEYVGAVICGTKLPELYESEDDDETIATNATIKNMTQPACAAGETPICDTSEVDAQWAVDHKLVFGSKVVSSKLFRKIERENSALRAALEKSNELLEMCYNHWLDAINNSNSEPTKKAKSMSVRISCLLAGQALAGKAVAE